MILTLLLSVTLVNAFDPEIQEKFKILPKNEFITYFNAKNFTWKIARYEDNRTLPRKVSNSDDEYPIADHDLSDLKIPENFDSRTEWSNCTTIGEIYDQGQCGSCWTFGTGTTASDRTCIHGGQIVRLSQQDFSCCSDCFKVGKTVCIGGYPDRALSFWVNHGLVTNECKPYNIPDLQSRGCIKECKNGKNYTNDKHYGKQVYKISKDEEQIKAELFKNGPISASFEVYEDFFDYAGGIYEHKYGDKAGGHNVRIIGYGVENGVHYWLIANSWGKDWGEKGFIRYKSYQPDTGMENELMSGFPKPR